MAVEARERGPAPHQPFPLVATRFVRFVSSSMIFRQVLFWIHLAAGLVAGLAIALMCFTGTTLAFEKQLVSWAESDVRVIGSPTAGTLRLPLEELTKRLRETNPDARPTAIVVSSNATEAVAFTVDHDATFYVNPYSGEVRKPNSGALRKFLRAMEDWHRWLALSGDQRVVGKTINGICNAAFLTLAVSGLYLWIPRSLSWQSVRAISRFNFRLAGKARDLNWHNTIGFWCAPILIVLTLTAFPMSFRWANAFLYRATRTELPPAVAPGDPALQASPPTADAVPLNYEALIATAEKYVPKWSTVTVRLPGKTNDGGRRPSRRPAVALSIRPLQPSPRFETIQLTLNPYTGGVMRFENYSGASKGRKLRSWSRFLHTGEALGIGGQIAAAIASLGGVFLVYTGFALAARRFFGKRFSSASPSEFGHRA